MFSVSEPGSRPRLTSISSLSVSTVEKTSGAYRRPRSLRLKGSGQIDHAVFNCSDYPGIKNKLDAHDVNQTEQTLEPAGVRRNFVEIQKGAWLELIFLIEEQRAPKS